MQQPNDTQSTPEDVRRPLKRHRSSHSPDQNEGKRPHVQLAQLVRLNPTCSSTPSIEDSQMSTFALSSRQDLEFSNNEGIESLSLDHVSSQQTSCYDDPEFDQFFENLDEPASGEFPPTSSLCYEDEHTFSLDEADEEAFVELWDRDSRSADEYDPHLQRSSPHSNASQAGMSVNDPQLLPDAIDWTKVREHASKMPKQGSTLPVPGNSGSPVTKRDPATQGTSVSSTSQSSATIRNESPPHSTGEPLLKHYKTFFELKEMLDAKTEIFKTQDVTFELFARVIYSNRENFHKKQYFQFRSLLKDCPPYLNGILRGWEAGSPLDCAAQELLKPALSRAKCFCQCKLRRDLQAETGWSIVVLEIRPTTWKEIVRAMDALGRKDLDEPAGLPRG
ncbi:hypothetical protein ACJ41O_009799 [Fusarium nematophilum]